MRREFLKGYIMALAAAGDLHPFSEMPSVTLKKLVAAVGDDLGGALKELGALMIEQGADHVVGRIEHVVPFARGLVDRAKVAIREKGFAGWWRDMNKNYVRGADAMAGGQKRKGPR